MRKVNKIAFEKMDSFIKKLRDDDERHKVLFVDRDIELCGQPDSFYGDYDVIIQVLDRDICLREVVRSLYR